LAASKSTVIILVGIAFMTTVRRETMKSISS
jgi:hypothetical protein